MIEGEPRRVEELALEPVAAGVAVVGIAGHRIADRQQVRADLMRAPGLERHPQQRVVRQRALGLEVRDGGMRIVGVGGDLRPHTAVAAERRVDRPAPRRRPALDQRQVLAGDLALAQRGLQRGVDRLAARQHEQPRGVAVEPVHDAGTRRVGPAGDEPVQRLDERPDRMPVPGMDDDARGLVDHQQVLVLVGDPERRRRDVGVDLGLRRLERHQLTADQQVTLRPRPCRPRGPARRRSAARPWCASPRPRRGRRPAARPRPPRARAAPSFHPLQDVDQRDHARRDADVGDVERRPVRELDEVGHGAEPDAVDQVARRAADQQAGRQPHQPPVDVRDEERDQRRERDQRDHDDDRPTAREHAEGDAGVARVDQLDAQEELDLLEAGDLPAHDRLAELVGQHDRHRDQRGAKDRLTRAHGPGSISPTRIRPPMVSTRIATIGLKSIGPNCRPRRRKIRRYGFVTSRRKSRTAFSGREYGTRTPKENTQETMIDAKMISV